MDWAEKKAREIVEAYRPFVRDDAQAAVGGLINVVAGELRAAEATARRQAIDAGEALLVELKRLTCT